MCKACNNCTSECTKTIDDAIDAFEDLGVV
jgi:hypothetical protein